MRDDYRVGVIGRTGRGDYGHGLDVVWQQVPEAIIVAVADDDKTGLGRAAQRLGVDRAYTDYRQMLDEMRPDIVSVASRWVDQHHDMVVAAAERGIHVYMEKPLCRTLAEADAMIDACERTHVKVAVAHQTRYSPRAAVARDLVHAGKIGRVLEYRGRGKEDARGGGEDLWVLGTHVMDLIRFFGGDATWCFASVLVSGARARAADVVEGNEGIGPLVGDAVRAIYGMHEGTASFGSYRNLAGSPSRFGLQICGSQGILEITTGYLPAVKLLEDPSWSPGRSGAPWQDVSSAGVGQPEPLEDTGLQGGNLAAARDLLDSIEGDRQPQSSIYEARAATEMIVAVFESHRVNGPVTLPLENRANPLASPGLDA